MMNPPMIRVIINADDFGFCRSVNEGVVLAHRRGVVTSASILANAPGFEQAAALASENPGLGVGVHLNVIKGEPLSPREKVPGLIGPGGRFWTNPYRFAARLAFGGIRPAEVEREARAQIERALRAGIRVTHIDSEKHIHALPAVLGVVLELAKEYGIRGVRSVGGPCFVPRPSPCLKAAAFSLGARFLRKRIRDHDIMTPDRLYGLCRSGRLTADGLGSFLRRAADGVSEIMVHPGFMTPELLEAERRFGSARISNLRERELVALLDPRLKEMIRRRGIRLIHYGGMAGDGA